MVFIKSKCDNVAARSLVHILAGLTDNPATHTTSMSRGRVNVGHLIGPEFNNQTITLTYTVTTKRIAMTGPAALLDGSMAVLSELDASYSTFCATGEAQSFSHLPKACMTAITSLVNSDQYHYEGPKSATQGVQKAMEASGVSGASGEIADPVLQAILSDIVAYGQDKLDTYPIVCNMFRDDMVKRFGSGILGDGQDGDMIVVGSVSATSDHP